MIVHIVSNLGSLKWSISKWTSLLGCTIARVEERKIVPFMYPDADLNKMGVKKEYAWKTAVVPWDWNEELWAEQLFQCLEQQLTGKSSTYRAEISTIFENVMDLQATPFNSLYLIVPKSISP